MSEKAYKWFNPEVNFQNRFFTVLENTENVVSQIDSVANEVLSVEDTVGQIKQQSQELKDSLAQKDSSSQGTSEPEAEKVKALAEKNKLDSAAPLIAPFDQVKPEP